MTNEDMQRMLACQPAYVTTGGTAYVTTGGTMVQQTPPPYTPPQQPPRETISLALDVEQNQILSLLKTIEDLRMALRTVLEPAASSGSHVTDARSTSSALPTTENVLLRVRNHIAMIDGARMTLQQLLTSVEL